jgi:hypothetical protein
MKDRLARRLGLAMFAPAVLIWLFVGISVLGSSRILNRPFEVLQPLVGFFLIWYLVGTITLLAMLVLWRRTVSRSTWWMVLAMAVVSLVPILWVIAVFVLLTQWRGQ